MQVMVQQAVLRIRAVQRGRVGIQALLVVVFLIGVFTVRQFGESWDELQFFKYADRALQAYSAWPSTGTIPLTGNTYDNYGPAYIMLVALGARVLGWVLPWLTSDLRHLVYFITYLFGIWAFYALARRWLAEGAAMGATVLFATQPLFWGHAFISPKDIPFLTFFLLTLESGLRMADNLPAFSIDGAGPRLRRSQIPLTVAWFALLLAAYAATPLIQNLIAGLVNAAATGRANILTLLGSNPRPDNAQTYVQHYFVYFLWLRAAFFVLTAAALLWAWRTARSTMQVLLAVLPAGILLGVTTSVRVLGPFAGLMVAGYALWKRGRQALPALAIYAGIAAIGMYLTWPYLWPNPLGHLVESIRVMSEYPWKGQVLFNGASYASTALPRSYLPVLLGIQLTEPVWFLFAAGLALAIIGAIRRDRSSRVLLALTSVWFILPLLGFTLTRSPLYDNFRQIIFILPPVFLLAGLAFQQVRRPLLQAVLVGLLILPGLVDGVRLHPYEYIYYNRFVGGVHGAFRRFELDYWGTSYREAANVLNRIAAPNATVWVEGPAHLLQLYARPDMKTYSTYEAERADHYDYVVAISRYSLDLTTYPVAPVIHIIERDGAVLAVIKKP